jgi:hypothetical protein
MSTTLLGLGNRFRTLVTVVIYSDPPTLDRLSALLLNKETKAKGESNRS